MKPFDGSFDETLDQALDETLSNESQSSEPHRDSTPARVPSAYDLKETLGRGGMGEVMLAKDKKLGRYVAIKRLRATNPSSTLVARFLREARIQALLDHPAIVPVHELGEDADGRPFFTMKRLAGKTLHDLLKFPDTKLRRLLGAFVDVCLAIEFAHQRGIIHRDLKPANIMLGNYGEVWVLDWGVARVIGEGGEAAGIPIESVDEPGDSNTQAGAVLGTPGYMSPEQMRGEEITAATDVYALGCILFEILVGQPLHPRGAAAVTTLAEDYTVAPRKRAPDRNIAPELDEACCAALVAKPDARPSARDLADAVQRYLDGDRDVERRHALAAEQLASAREVLATDRAAAMRRAGRALALEPDSRDAAALVTQLMLEPPNPPPPALAKRLDAIDGTDIARQGRYAAVALCGYLAFLPVLAAIGIKDWTILGTAIGVVVAMIVAAIFISKKRIARIEWAVIGQAVLLILLARVFSPYIVIPAVAVATVAALSSFPTLRVWFVVPVISIGLVVPVFIDEMVQFSSAGIAITPGALELPPTATPALLLASHIVIVTIVGFVVRALALARRQAQRTLEGQSWMLEQLLPQR